MVMAGAGWSCQQAPTARPPLTSIWLVEPVITATCLNAWVGVLVCAAQAGTLLVAPLPPAAGPLVARQAKDPQALVAGVQAQVLAAVMPLWGAPQLGSCSQQTVAVLASVMCQCAGEAGSGERGARGRDRAGRSGQNDGGCQALLTCSQVACCFEERNALTQTAPQCCS